MLSSRESASVRIVAAVLDQAGYAGANLILTLILAGIAGVEAVGRYALLYTATAVAHSFLAGLLLDPMTTLASGRGAARIRLAYGRILVLGCAAIMAVAIVGYFAIRSSGDSFWSGLALGMILFTAQAQLLGYKRYLFVTNRVSVAAIASATYAMLAVTFATAFAVFGTYSETTLVFCSAGAAGLASLPFWWRMIQVRCDLIACFSRSPTVTRYTMWSVATSLPAAAALQSVYWTGGLVSSVHVVGQVKLLEQIMMPASQILGAVTLLDQVKCAAAFAQGRWRQAIAHVRSRAWQYALFAITYVGVSLVAIWTAAEAGFPVDIGGGWALVAYGIGMVALGASAAHSIGLKSAQRPEYLTLAYSAMALFVGSGAFWLDQIAALQLAALMAGGWWVRFVVLAAAFTPFARRIDSDRPCPKS